MDASPAASRPFRGWQMVRVAFLVDFIAVGFYFYSFGVYYPSIAADFSGASFGVALGLSVSNLVGGFLAPFVGRALDRYPIRWMMVTGSVLVSAGFLLLSLATTYLQYYLVLGTFFAIGLGMMGGMASSKLVANWFVARRGNALGIATMGVSLSGLVMPTVANWLVAELGWRGGFRVYSAGILVIVLPVVLLFVVSRPEDVGQRPDGEAPPSPSSSEPLPLDRVWRAREILRSRNFWVIALPFGLAFSALSSILIHVVPYANDLGIDGYRAGYVLSASAGAGVLGKVTFGRLVDRLDARPAVWTSFAAQALGLVLLMQAGHFATLVAAALIFGFGMGGVVPLQSAVTGKAFGRLSFGEALGLMRPVQVPLHVIGIPLAAWIHDETGSFDAAWWIFLVVYLISALLISGLRAGEGPRVDASVGETGFV